MPTNKVETRFAAWVDAGGMNNMRPDEHDRNYSEDTAHQEAPAAIQTTNIIGQVAVFSVPYDGTEKGAIIIDRYRINDPLQNGI